MERVGGERPTTVETVGCLKQSETQSNIGIWTRPVYHRRAPSLQWRGAMLQGADPLIQAVAAEGVVLVHALLQRAVAPLQQGQEPLQAFLHRGGLQ